jgi:hypothetical protein
MTVRILKVVGLVLYLFMVFYLIWASACIDITT